MVKSLQRIIDFVDSANRELNSISDGLDEIILDFLDLLCEVLSIDGAVLKNTETSRLYLSRKLEKQNLNLSDEAFSNCEIPDWGNLYVLNLAKTNQTDLCSSIISVCSILVSSIERKEKTDLILSLTSELRQTPRPDLALNKLFNGLSDFFGVEELLFIKRNEDLDYVVFFHRSTSGREILAKPYIEELSLTSIKNLSLVAKDLELVILPSKARTKQIGFLLVARKLKWSKKDQKILALFAEQIATVFLQHELHSESLSMAQREFLLNQVTTNIRESLEVDKIIEIAAKETAQVMGADSCGILILSRRIRGRLTNYSWSVDSRFDAYMSKVLFSILATGFQPGIDDSTVLVNDLSRLNDLHAQELNKKYHLKSFLATALYKNSNEDIIGIISLGFFSRVRYWTDGEKQLLESISRQVEIALIQASVHQESQQTKRQMALLHRLSSDIRDSLELSVVLGKIAKGIGEVLGLSRCFVRRFASDRTILKTEREYVANGYAPSSDMIFGFEKEWLQNELSSSEILNITSVMDFAEKVDSDLVPIIAAIELKSYLAVPIFSRGKVLGTINIHQCDRERSFLDEEIDFIVKVASDASIAIEHAELFETIDKLSKTDPDTKLYNKKYFKQISEREIRQSKEEGKPLSYVLLDLDYLKNINDTYGHEAGDIAINYVADVLEKTVRQTPMDEAHKRLADVVGRFGGDEFMILLPNTSLENALKVCHRISENIASIELDGKSHKLSCSIGVSGTPYDPYDYDELKRRADQALYLSKNRGRNCISSSMDLEYEFKLARDWEGQGSKI
jgi:diguanylate cyclase (GGDEF)-like protein